MSSPVSYILKLQKDFVSHTEAVCWKEDIFSHEDFNIINLSEYSSSWTLQKTLILVRELPAMELGQVYFSPSSVL